MREIWVCVEYVSGLQQSTFWGAQSDQQSIFSGSLRKCCHSSNTLNVHTDVNAAHGKPTVKDCWSTFWKWHTSWAIWETHLRANSSECIFYQQTCILRELPTVFESLRESSIFTVKIETVGYSIIMSNWISEIQQSVSVKHNRLLEEETTREFITLIARF